jgi:transporter family protein
VHQIVGAVVLQAVALALGAAALLYLRARGASLPVTAAGVRWAVLAGIAVGLAEILTFFLFAGGTTAARGVPFVIGGGIAVGALLGVIVLRESLSVVQWTGLTLVVVGVVLLTTRGAPAV